MNRVRDAGDSAMLLTLGDAIDPGVNARVIAAAAAFAAEHVPGVRDVVPTYCSVAVHFDPLVTDASAVRAALERAGEATPGAEPRARVVEVPVAYGGEFGPDLAAVASFAGMTAGDVIERHTAAAYRVYMLGFLPGFPYLGRVPSEIAMPRRATPRLKVPSGSVGIAGTQTGIYPVESPGGWQIIGRTSLRLFDITRERPALCAPGDVVRFVPIGPAKAGPHEERAGPPQGGPHEISDMWGPPSGGPMSQTSRTITVLEPGLFTTIQDRGRWGQQALGVPVSGAMDLVAHDMANALVGNAADAATLEATLLGPELRLDVDATVAVAGADLGASIDGADLLPGTRVRGRAGSVIRFGQRRHGARAYLAFDGGIDTPLVLGSRSTHTRSGLGGFRGRAVAGGDQIPLGAPCDSAPPAMSGRPGREVAGGARLRVLPGPQDACFPAEAIGRLQRTRYLVSPQSDRMGYRLSGAPIPGPMAGEMISDAAFTGAIQVPPSGEPILLMADRQTTGGYPQIATVITADLPRASQLAPGDWVEFECCTRRDAIQALNG